MTGLEKILSQIEYESNDRCQNMIQTAEKNAASIIAEAENEARQLSELNRSETEKKIETLRQSAESSSALTKSRMILEAKLKTIDEILLRSLDLLKALPAEEYFMIIRELIIKNAKVGIGTLCLSRKDKEALPDGFIDSVNAALDQDKSIVLGECAEIDSGCLLVYGDIDINCSFDAIASSKRDELRDALNGLLFH